MKLARQIIDALANDWKPERYHDTYTEELRALIEKKRKGEKITVDEPSRRDAPTPTSSTSWPRSRRASRTRGPVGARRRVAAKKKAS